MNIANHISGELFSKRRTPTSQYTKEVDIKESRGAKKKTNSQTSSKKLTRY